MSDVALYESRPIDTLKAKDGETFSLVLGLSREHVAQLKRYSLDLSDTDLQNNTSDYKRFGEGSYEEWFAKERTPYALVSESGVLAALAWFGPKPLGRKSLRYLSAQDLSEETSQPKTGWHTIVYRAYNPYRGKGLMTRFVSHALTDYLERHPNARLWAGVSTKNEASIALASRLGFVIKPELSDDESAWTAMIYEPAKH